MIPPRLHRTSRVLLFALLLFAAATIREGPTPAVNQAIIWVPTGVAVAGLWLLGLRAAWVVALVTLVQRFALNYDLNVALPAAVGSTAEAVVGVFVLQRLGFRASLRRLRDVMALLVAASIAPLASIFCSYLGRSFFWTNPDMPFYSGWDGWWRMNALGVLTVVPAAVTWLSIPRREFTPRLALGAALALVGVPALLFGAMQLVPQGIIGVMCLNLVLALVLYVAVRFGIRGATLAGALAALAVSVATTQGFGPFLELPREQRHVALQLFELSFVAIPAAFSALIAERQTAHDRGARSEDLLASLNRNVKEGLFRATPDLRLVYANLALARLLGHESPEQILGRSLAAAIGDPERRSELTSAVEQQGQWLGEDVRFERTDGTSFWGRMSVTAIRDPNGATLHYDGAIADITARKELEEQFRQSQKMEAVGQLAGGVAHDFNNLLTVIFGYAEAIRGQVAERSPIRAQADQVLEAAKRASGLTRQLLAYSRRQVLSPQTLDMAAVVDQMGDMLRRLIGEDVGLVIAHSARECWVRVDRSQLEQVLLNLVVNARDAMPAGGTLTLTTAVGDARTEPIRAHRDHLAGACVTLRVQDTGTGMASDVQARAFDPFFTTKGPGKGTGLGLSTVYGIMKQSGGSVWLESTPGVGTTFWIALPRVPAPIEPVFRAPSTPGGPIDATLMVVEDEPLVRNLVCRTLEQAGYRVLEGVDGIQGAEAGQRYQGPIDLVVTDVVMPRMGGREMARLLLAERPGLRFLFITGYPDDARELDAFVGATGEWLPKPFTPDQLIARVRGMLRARAQATTTALGDASNPAARGPRA